MEDKKMDRSYMIGPKRNEKDVNLDDDNDYDDMHVDYDDDYDDWDDYDDEEDYINTDNPYSMY